MAKTQMTLVSIWGVGVDIVEDYKYLGVYIVKKLGSHLLHNVLIRSRNTVSDAPQRKSCLPPPS